MRNLLLLIVVLGTLSFTLSKEVTRNFEKTAIAPGKISPDFSFKDNTDKLIKLEDFKGKFVYINLWTTWSKPSKEGLPHLEELTKLYNDDIVFINISVDYKRDRSKWLQAIKDQNLKGIQLIADNDWQSDFIKNYNVINIPRAILIDTDGKIIDAFAPKPSQEKLKDLLNSILKK